MTLGQKLKISRKNAGITQRELGRLVGISQQAITQYENDKSRPTNHILIKLADVLDDEALLTLDWDNDIKDVREKADLIRNNASDSFEYFLVEHGTHVYTTRNDEYQMEYLLTFDGDTHAISLEMWENLHNHLYAVCKEFIKALAEINVKAHSATARVGCSDNDNS